MAYHLGRGCLVGEMRHFSPRRGIHSTHDMASWPERAQSCGRIGRNPRESEEETPEGSFWAAEGGEKG